MICAERVEGTHGRRDARGSRSAERLGDLHVLEERECVSCILRLRLLYVGSYIDVCMRLLLLLLWKIDSDQWEELSVTKVEALDAESASGAKAEA